MTNCHHDVIDLDINLESDHVRVIPSAKGKEL
jgi:hypothetical protein